MEYDDDMEIEKRIDELLRDTRSYLRKLNKEMEDLDMDIHMIQVEDFLKNGPGGLEDYE